MCTLRPPAEAARRVCGGPQCAAGDSAGLHADPAGRGHDSYAGFPVHRVPSVAYRQFPVGLPNPLVAGAIAAARPDSGTDILIGTGGTPEGIIAAAAMRCMGGALQGRLAPTDDAERQKAVDAGHDLDRILNTTDFANS